MSKTVTMLSATAILALALASPAFAGRGGGGGGGGNGGDREPAGGAFMSSYPEPGSTGIQRGGPPRSADIPRPPYGQIYDPEATGSITPAPRPRGYYYYGR